MFSILGYCGGKSWILSVFDKKLETAYWCVLGEIFVDVYG